MRKRYSKLAQDMVETLFEDHLDLERFLSALCQEMASRANEIRKNSDDYDAGDVNWADNQERDYRLYLEGLTDAANELGVVVKYAPASMDQLDLAHVKAALCTLHNMKLRIAEVA